VNEHDTPRKKSVSFFVRHGQHSWLYVLALAIVTFFVFSVFFFSGGMLSSSYSDQLQGFDARVFLKSSLLKFHQMPFWLSPRLGGMPTIDALFGDVFYPFTIVFNAILPVPQAISFKMIFHIFLAGLFFFLLLRKGFKISAPLAFIGGAFYMLNPQFFSLIYPGHDGKMFVIAWIPFMVWQIKELAETQKFVHAILLGIGIGMSILTSQIQSTYFAMWGLGAYAAFAMVHALVRHEGGKAMRVGCFFVIACVVGLGIGFIQLYPSFMYVRDAFSVRSVDRGFDYATSWSLHWPEFFSLWVPEFGNTLRNYWGGNAFKLNSEYAGSIVVFLAILSVIWKSRPWRWFWLGVAVFAVLFALGAETPFFSIVYSLVYGVKKFRAPSMIMFWFSFSTDLLAVFFLKDLFAGELTGMNELRRRKWTKGLIITAAGFLVVAIVFSMKDLIAGLLPFTSTLDTEKQQVFDANFSRNFVPMLWLWLFFSIITIGCVIAVIQKKIKAGVAIGVILVIGAIDVLRVDAQFIEIIDPRPYFADEPAFQDLRSKMVQAPFRCFSLAGTLSQNSEGIHGLEGVGGFHDNELHWYREFRGDQQDRNYYEKLIGQTGDGQAYLISENLKSGNNFLNLANAKYYLIRQGHNLLSIKNEGALERLSFAAGYVVIDSLRIIDALKNNEYDIRTTVALSQEPDEKPGSTSGSSARRDSLGTRVPFLSVQWEKYTPNYREAAVDAQADGFLRISEVYYPGWKVSIDGKPVKIYRADGAWMAVNLHPGRHIVEMMPHSLYFAKAMRVTFSTLIFLCLFVLFSIGMRAKRMTRLTGSLPQVGV
jgi:hypothetical protein